MNKILLAAAVAGLSMVAASSASASAITSAAATGSSLVLSVWDVTAQTSYSQVLGSTVQSFLANNSFATETLGTSNWTSFSSSVTWGSDQVVYEVTAATKAGTSANFGFASTVSTNLNDPSSVVADNVAAVAALQAKYVSGLSIQTVGTKLDGFYGFINTAVAASNDVSAASTDPFYAGNIGTNINGALLGALNATVNVGQDAGFFFDTLTALPGKTLKNQPTAHLLGNWNFSGQTGVLSYSAPSVAAVPVPAAAWMMLSGLVGLLSFRRNKA